MIHKHHRKRRPHCTAEEYDHPINIFPMQDEHHELVHKNTGLAYTHGLLIPSWQALEDAPAPDLDGFLAALGRTPVGTGVPGGEEPMQTTVTGDEVPHSHVVDDQGVEKPCPKCHGAGKIVVKAKPAETEKTERATESPIYNARTPKGHSREVLETDEEQITDLLVKAGILRGHQGARWWVIHYAYRFVLMNARAFVTDLTKGEGGE